MPDQSSAKPDVQTPNVSGMRNEKGNFHDDGKTAPPAPKTSGGSEPEGNPLETPADLRDAGMPVEPATEEPRTGRSD